ncbi:MAG: hypothetical protein ACR2NX_09515 [Chthoniobacterales bacterium]
MFRHLGDEGVHVVAREEEFVHVVGVAGMHGDFRGRQTEDEPAVAGIDGGELQDVAQEGAIGPALVL